MDMMIEGFWNGLITIFLLYTLNDVIEMYFNIDVVGKIVDYINNLVNGGLKNAVEPKKD